MNLDFDPMIDHYKALGVAAGASADDIKKAYRKLAKANHPDSTGGDKAKEARFKEISAAYEVLGDAKKRAQYDEIREQLRSGHVRASGPRPGARGHAGPQVWDLSDLFGQFFAGGAAGGPGSGFRVEQVQVDPDDGWAPFGGAGPTQQRRRRQRRRHEHEPAAPPPQTKLQAPDGSWLTVQGADIHSDLRLPFADAILGTVRDVATLTGATSVKIPPGTSSGKKLRLKGKGLGTPDGGTGDHYVTIQIDVPADLDDEARRLLNELTTHLRRKR
jgi:DnaJ-class molecular chaperone